MSVHVLARADNIPSREQLPFRNFEKAHQRLVRARIELKAAHAELSAATLALEEVGYRVQTVEAALSPPLPDTFDAERDR